MLVVLLLAVGCTNLPDVITSRLTPSAQEQTVPQPSTSSELRSTPATGAQNVELLVLPEDNEQSLLDMISTAKQRVLITIYLLTDDRFISAAQAAKRNGADVRVILEESPYRGGTAARQAYEKLRSAGINVRYGNPQFRLTHQKSMVVDGHGVVMSANLTKSAYSSNRGFAVLLDNSNDVNEMARVFYADWNRTAVVPVENDLVWSPDNARERLGNLIANASATIYIYAEITQDNRTADLIAQAAQRGVKVRLLISPQSEAESDSNKANLDTMQSSGVAIKYLRSPYIHAKMYLVDGKRSFIGSQNISATSLEFNRELGILITDSHAIGRMQAVFSQDWNKATDRIE
jgi:phosphatidylserine/phosphatidylglycerophosphate/cardiolipin synthase-like enzyme